MLKDISNIQSTVNATEDTGDLDALVTRLRENEGIIMYIISCFMTLVC